MSLQLVTLLLLFVRLVHSDSRVVREMKSSLSASKTYEVGSRNYMNKEQWQCGSGGFDTRFAHGVITDNCWDRVINYNMCCVIHDDCYMNRRGRDECDIKFCVCLSNLTETSYSSCNNAAYGFVACMAVAIVGSKAYEIPRGGDRNIRYTPAVNMTAKLQYRLLYKECPDITKSISTCAYNHIVCHLNMLTDQDGLRYEDCLDSLIDCIDNTSSQLVDDSSHCRMKVEEIAKFLSEDSTRSQIAVYRKPKIIRKLYNPSAPAKK